MDRLWPVSLALLLLLPGCLQEQRTVAVTHELDNDRDRALEWLQVRFKGGDHLPAKAGALSFSVTGPGGARAVPACQTTHLEGDGCRDPLATGETVAAGTTLHLPCPRAGVHLFEVRFQGGPTLSHEMDCGEAA